MQDFETLGAFYLGRPYDLATRTATPAPLMYDSRDLLTHAVCIGMTGSGKTGLCIGLLEEALIDGIPAIVIDPKGDLANLALTFPSLSGEAFAPWVNEDEAQRAGQDVPTFAAAQAERWRKGLEGWGQDGARIQRLKDAAGVTIYTPGSSAGVPVSILKSFAVPPAAVLEDRDLLRERLQTTVASLLGLAGIDADPLQSREHILLAKILETAWLAGTDLDLVGIIQQIQSPPFTRIGALELDAFYPAKERFGLAMALNNLLAAPGFDQWLTGAPLDVASFLRTEDGRPRAAIFSIAHLSDAERMFFVSLLLNELLGWVRMQSGTTSLRALLYMDEIFGYMPPVANPPSKEPLMLLLKQARAFGLGVVLATQNPVDLDYKGLSNTGTWFIGRLQTERDKARVLEGLAGAAGGERFDRAAMSETLSGLGARVFLMHNVHETSGPLTFETRWTLSYLRGPLTRTHIKALRDGSRPAAIASEATGAGPAASATGQPLTGAAAAPSTVTAQEGGAAPVSAPPVLPPGVTALFVPARGVAPGAPLAYVPAVYVAGAVRVADTKRRIAETIPVQLLVPLQAGATPLALDRAEDTDVTPEDLESSPRGPATYADLPAGATTPKNLDAWKRAVATWLYDTRTLTLLEHRESGLHSTPGETEADFHARLSEALRVARDAKVDALRARYAARLQAQEERIRRAEQALGKQQQEVSASTGSALLTAATGVFGALFGRKALSATNAGRIGSAARGASKVMKEKQDVARAEENLAAEHQKLADLRAAVESEAQEIAATDAGTVTPLVLRPKKTDVTLTTVSLTWVAR
ncbi:hypothetical protein TBR22_A41220 [Luteitalea sp. TBR-22]|uniref:helicase HerA domain-containing protein n=1 Tax=Luteitalea sp. TBR-22 TaxID=2802971 RepID=UPI001AF572BB|nr:DUF87 domain-containing protein [Luteitalea sp. TBR-22]BCS34896.1 hypothetical protein TBR22_A41220 [Luteitalea sp. TBR-22]